MKLKLLIPTIAVFLAISVLVHADDDQDSHERVVIYPILFQAPIYGANVKLPSIPGEPGIDRSTDYNLDSAFLAGVTVEQNKWFVEFEGEYAGLSANRETPLLNVDTDLYYVRAMAGWRIGNGFAVDGGFKALSVHFNMDAGNGLEAHPKRTLWDPMVGIDWRAFVTKRLELNAALEGGGFGVGTDVDISGRFNADWEFLPHVILDLGYNFFYFRKDLENVTVGSDQRELKMRQTLHGPRVGLGIRF
jgi:hypothetical protein